MIKLSIIIPVYNTGRYVERCIRSCLEQDVQHYDYEIIVIDDGSPDNSLSIIEKIASEQSNIKVISQKNEGLSAARNKGFDLAEGDYVWFIDSDDWIKENCLSDILYKLYDAKLEAMVISSINVLIDGTEAYKRTYYYAMGGKKVLRGVDFIKKRGFPPCVPFTIYQRDFLLRNDLSFTVGLLHEDSEFTPRAYYYLKRIQTYDKMVYYVFQNTNSITRSVNFKKAFDCIRVADFLYKFTQSVDKQTKYIFCNNIGLAINNGLSTVYLMPRDVKLDFSCFVYQHKHLYYSLIRSSIIKYKIEGLLFIIFPRKVISIYNFLQLFNHKKSIRNVYTNK